ncbi:N-acetyltransferase [Geomicrobium sp. JCM 19055]|uniref:GNAT family N-acetyltransferase n=1 Tax=Geomicrobium sp. JCM 19055 TaxID=1460649 RepID=UPI00045EDDC7|nr:GNAT family N-acetyltransferase [Geomicrobium sp. JCM 19055]GAJ98346.1 acetyltransferase, GNAT family [Geomicrobium sp. JCM 19055]
MYTDKEDVRIVQVEVVDESLKALLLLADPNLSLVEKYVERGFIYGLRNQDQWVGEYVLLGTGPQTVEIMNVAVREDAQGNGYGEMLVRDAIKRAFSEGYHRIDIATGSTGTQQLYLYQKCGFRMMSIERDYFVEHYDEPIYEHGIQLRDLVRLSISRL